MGEILHKCQFGAKLSQLIHFQVIFAFYQSSALGTLSLPGLVVESVSQCIGMEGVREKCLIPRSLTICSISLHCTMGKLSGWSGQKSRRLFFKHVGNHHYGKNREIEDFCPDAGPQCTDALRLSQATNVPICTLHPLPKCLFWNKSNYFLSQLDIRHDVLHLPELMVNEETGSGW